MTKAIIGDIDELRDIYNEECAEYPDSLSADKFEEFLEFLEIDYYDWVRGNLRYFGNKY